jgi:transposase
MLACGRCDRVVQAQEPSRPIAWGLAEAGLLVHLRC